MGFHVSLGECSVLGFRASWDRVEWAVEGQHKYKDLSNKMPTCAAQARGSCFGAQAGDHKIKSSKTPRSANKSLGLRFIGLRV